MSANELTDVSAPFELPIAGQPPRQRADAVRNQDRVLCTAARLFEERDPETVSMEAIAAAAGVGKGTLFRAFGDRAGLAAAVLSEREARLQDGMIRGPQPLGPGAPPLERIAAFGAAYMDHLERNVGLLLAAERGPGTRYRTAPFALYRTHVVMLVRDAVGDGVDAEYLADTLLAPLGADFFVYQRRVRERSLPELAGAYRGLVERVLTCR